MKASRLFYNELINSGIDKFQNDKEKIRYLQRSNFFNAFVLLLVPIFIPIFFWINAQAYAWSLAAIALTTMIVFMLNHRGYSYVGRILQLLSYLIWVTFYCWVFGKESGVQNLYIIFSSMPFLLLPSNQLKYQLGVVLLYALGYILVSNDYVAGPSILERSDGDESFRIIVETLTFLWITANFFYFNYTNSLYEKKVQKGLKKLQSSNKEMERFVYIASHDLQEPLRNISSFADLYRDEYGSSLNKDQSTYLSFIERSANRMQELIHALMSHSQIGLNRKKVHMEFKHVIDDALEDLSRQIIKSGAIIQYEAERMPVVYGMPVEIRLLVQNLVSNAIKFAKENQPPIIQIEGEARSKSVEFRVIDNGIGIEEKSLEKVFGMFKRLHSKDVYEGSGIGLAHCKKIVDLHNGSISVNSILGEGTVAEVILPIQETEND